VTPRMDGRVLPYDLDAERYLLGAILYSHKTIAEVVPIVTATDFYSPAHSALFQACMDEWRVGGRPDPLMASRRLDKATLDDLGGMAGLKALIAATPSSSSAPRYAEVVASCATRRRVIAAAGEIAQNAYDVDDAAEVLDGARQSLAGIASPVGRLPDNVWALDDFCERPSAARAPWVIPGLIRQDWRILAVGLEGSGKTTLFRQLALCAAQGIHPLAFTPIPPVRTLLVDFENPEDAITENVDLLRVEARALVRDEYDRDRPWLWHEQGGVNLRSRAGKADFESVLMHTRPDLVCLGPLYKAYEASSRESDEQVASDVQRCLDDLRSRYRFGLIMEHHAPKGTGATRDILPQGSALWLRWPEMGLKLVPADERSETVWVKRFRPDRLQCAWPDALVRSRPWPWSGRWPDGFFSKGAA
jgi:hypothetical protein